MTSFVPHTMIVFLTLSARHHIEERKYTERLSVWMKNRFKWMKASVILPQSLHQPKTVG